MLDSAHPVSTGILPTCTPARLRMTPCVAGSRVVSSRSEVVCKKGCHVQQRQRCVVAILETLRQTRLLTATSTQENTVWALTSNGHPIGGRAAKTTSSELSTSERTELTASYPADDLVREQVQQMELE